jgi:hypothetical protein
MFELRIICAAVRNFVAAFWRLVKIKVKVFAMSVLDDIKAKYQKTETVADAYGRVIVVRRLSPSQQITVREWANTTDDSVIGMLSFAASVASIDGALFPFPKDRKELNGTIDALDDKGLEAVGGAYLKFAELEKDTLDKAKNSAATDTPETS